LYQIRYALAYNSASDMPFVALPNSLGLERLGKRAVRDPHTDCVKTGVFHPLGQA
jgi:hypothetical protein